MKSRLSLNNVNIRISAIIAVSAMLMIDPCNALAQKQREASPINQVGGGWQKIEVAVQQPKIEVQITSANGDGGTDGGPCAQELVTYSNHSFGSSGGFVAQAGFVAQEIAAVTYTIDPLHFPIRIDRVDGLFGTQSPQVQITTHWSLLVWAGEPNTGQLVYTIESDGINPPHMVISPPTNGIIVQASVDPNDPDQIIVPNNGSNKFTVGFRIDQMNSPPTQSCNGGFTPAPCCPHNPSANIFPTTDLNGLQQTANNWLYARPGCGFGSLSGWYTFQQLQALGGAPSGDWNIRAVYTPTGCTTPVGACCLPTGACLSDLTNAECVAQGGVYQGNSSNCGAVNCPIPTGACCLPNGNCTVATIANCDGQGGTFMGANSECNTSTCRGACCVPSTQQCVFTTQPNCNAAGGFFQGLGTNCTTTACFGACCLPDGSCVNGTMPANCAEQGGVFQGADSTCAQVNCPPPLGACCLGTICLSDETQADCVGGFGGTWQGPLSICSPNPCAAPPSCPADISGDNVVNANDLLAVINNWGPCPQPCPPNCDADVTSDCIVNANDLLAVINAWGPCN